MSLRFSIQEALEKGWITPDQAKRQKSIARVGNSAYRGVSENHKTIGSHKISQKKKKSSRLLCSLEGDMPQEKLWRACVQRWPEKIQLNELVWEYPGAVPGRRYRLDIAFVPERLACEVDGWEFHGKYLADFKRDRSRDRLLVGNGWRVLRFFAEEIHANPHALVDEISKALARSC